MRLLLCRTCLQYSFSLLRFIMKEWFCRYGTGPPMVKWYYSICKQLQFIVDIRNRNRKKCSKLTLFLKGGLSLIFRKHFLFAASVNCPVIDNQRKWGKVAAVVGEVWKVGFSWDSSVHRSSGGAPRPLERRVSGSLQTLGLHRNQDLIL